MSDQGNKPAEPKPPIDWDNVVKAGTKPASRLPAEQPTKELAERVEKLGE
jgi:hypothetical protein